MNLDTVLALVLPILMLIWGSIHCRREAKRASTTKDAKMWRYGSLTLLGIAIVLVFSIIASQVDIPNPFAPTSSESSPASGFSRNFDDTLAVPETNANPARAAEDNRKLLEEVRHQQQDK